MFTRGTFTAIQNSQVSFIYFAHQSKYEEERYKEIGIQFLSEPNARKLLKSKIDPW